MMEKSRSRGKKYVFFTLSPLALWLDTTLDTALDTSAASSRGRGICYTGHWRNAMKNLLFDERRTAQAAAFLLFRAGGTLPVVKLMKLLYLAERLSLQRYGEPITGDSLVSMPHGPVLSMTYDHINGAARSVYGGWDSWITDRSGHRVSLADPSRIRSPEQDLLRLSDSDLEVLTFIWEEFGHLGQWELVFHTHSTACPEWEDPEGSSRPISYERLFLHMGFSEARTHEAVARPEEQMNINAAFDEAATA
jgi:uncharacterized phage-associated protein